MFRKIMLFALIAFTATGLSFCSGETKASKNIDLSGNVQWESLEKGLERSIKEGKPLIMYFHTEWCTYCKKMDSDIFKDREITDLMNNNYINVKVNPENEKGKINIMGDKITAMELMTYMGGKGFPATVFWDKSGKPVTTFPGYMKRDVFLPLIKYMFDECYTQNIKLNDYIEGKASCAGPGKS